MSLSFDNYLSIKDKLPLCSCKRDTVQHMCTRPTCPNNQSQQMYCQLCLEDENTNHDHGATPIFNTLEALKKQWYDFSQKLVGLIQAADALKARYGKLLFLLDQQVVIVLKNSRA